MKILAAAVAGGGGCVSCCSQSERPCGMVIVIIHPTVLFIVVIQCRYEIEILYCLCVACKNQKFVFGLHVQ